MPMLLRSALLLILTAAAVAAQPMPEVEDRPVPDALRDQMAGRYALTMEGGPTLALRVYIDGGALMGAINDNDPTRMLYQGGDAFRPADAPVVLLTALEREGGVVTRLRVDTPDGPMDGVRTGDADADPATSGALFDALAEADRRLFAALFADCDADAALAMLDDDVEFFHDKGGRRVGADVHASIRSQAEGCPREQGITRILDPASLFVSPIPGLGAVQTGTHRFEEPGGTTVARFLHVWRETPDGWRAHRIVSYDHRPER